MVTYYKNVKSYNPGIITALSHHIVGEFNFRKLHCLGDESYGLIGLNIYIIIYVCNSWFIIVVSNIKYS
ncbi:Protein of unknown function [Gryllus bimaculatus]|nr:Protein of unknown function [Gryllus bimaculatus]